MSKTLVIIYKKENCLAPVFIPNDIKSPRIVRVPTLDAYIVMERNALPEFVNAHVDASHNVFWVDVFSIDGMEFFNWTDAEPYD